MITAISPFSILAISAILYSIFAMIMDKEGWGIVLTLFVVPIALLVWLIDLGIKRVCSNRLEIFGIELLIILIGLGIYLYGRRVQTLEIPSTFDKKYVSIIYGVDNTDKLSISPFTWSKTITIPEDGVLLTASHYKTNLPHTKLRFESGVPVTVKESGKGFIQLPPSAFEYNGKTYHYISWKIQEGDCCSWSSKEFYILDKTIKEEFEKMQSSR